MHKRFSIQILSDLHLEYYKKSFPTILPRTKYLALLGDIGKPTSSSYQKFIEEQSHNFEKIFLIAGNHEYYNSSKTMFQIEEKLEQINKQYNNVHYLQNKSINVDDFKILGCTLWSDISMKNRWILEEEINDYKKILKRGYNRKIPITCFDTVSLHKNSVRFIEEELKKTDRPIIVLSHHAPLRENYINPLNEAYCTDLSHLFKYPVRGWLYGHTHIPSEFEYRGIKIASNPFGYPGELNYRDIIIEI